MSAYLGTVPNSGEQMMKKTQNPTKETEYSEEREDMGYIVRK